MKSKLVTMVFNKEDKECVVGFGDIRIQNEFIKHQKEMEEIIEDIKAVFPNTSKVEITVTVYLKLKKDTPYTEIKLSYKGYLKRFIKRKIEEISRRFLPIFSNILLETIRNENEL